MFPGRDYHHQLSLILEVLGTPTLEEFYNINSRRSRDYLRAMPFKKKSPLETLFPVSFLHFFCGDVALINIQCFAECLACCNRFPSALPNF